MRLAAVLLAAAAVALPAAPAHAASGAYDAYLAPPSTCPGSDALTLLASEQVGAMLCLVDYVRATRGVPALARSPMLAESAGAKADDIVRCDEFSHTACGRSVEAPFEQSGYITSDVSWDVGENLAFGRDLLGSPRSIMRAWLESDGHRENLFAERWADQGVAFRKPSALLGLTAEAVWVSHFGRREEVASAPGEGTAPSADPAGGALSASVSVSVSPARARAGRRTRFRFLVKAASRPVKRATIAFAKRRATTDARGRATIAVVPRRAGKLRAVVTKPPSLRATASVRVTGG
ncbi:MAG TPA: CAP domain-containing protein [Solirubrobacteraceae bacterium]|nr:CAP domain-containing protein [Solirubrobacteraceae bacterium]